MEALAKVAVTLGAVAAWPAAPCDATWVRAACMHAWRHSTRRLLRPRGCMHACANSFMPPPSHACTPARNARIALRRLQLNNLDLPLMHAPQAYRPYSRAYSAAYLYLGQACLSNQLF